MSSAERKSAAVLRTKVESAEGDSQLEKEVLSRLTDPEHSPLLVESFEDLPNAYVVTVGFDVLRDDGLAYVRRMRKWALNANSSVLRVVHKHYADYGHGFMTSFGSNELQRDLAIFLNRHPSFL